MEIRLIPSLRAFINGLVARGVYPTVDDAMNAAVCALENEIANDPIDQLEEDELAELRREIQLGIDSIERGEGTTLYGEAELASYFEGVKKRGRERLATAQQAKLAGERDEATASG